MIDLFFKEVNKVNMEFLEEKDLLMWYVNVSRKRCKRWASAEAIKRTRAAIPGGYYDIDGTNSLFILSPRKLRTLAFSNTFSSGSPRDAQYSKDHRNMVCMYNAWVPVPLVRVLMFCRYSRDAKKKEWQAPFKRPRVPYMHRFSWLFKIYAFAAWCQIRFNDWRLSTLPRAFQI